MSFKDTWRPRVDGIDDADSSAVNEIAEEVIKLGEMGITVETLDSGSEPTVEKTDDGERVLLHFGIPAGKMPEKGVDYFTEEEKNEMVCDVLAALPNGDEVSY